MSFRLHCSLTLALGLVLILSASPVLCGPGAAILHEGGFASADLQFVAQPDGSVLPQLPQARSLSETDKPILARQSLSLLVPAQMRVTGVEVVALSTQQVSVPGRLQQGGELISSEGVSVPVSRLSAGAARYPQVWGEYGGSHVWRGFRLVTVQLYPLRAVRDEAGQWSSVEVLERYAIRIESEPGVPAGAITERGRLVPGERARSEDLLRRMVANPEALSGYVRADGLAVSEPAGGFQPSKSPTLSGSAVRYLIVTSEALAGEFQALADHKTAQGYPAVVSTLEWILANFRQGADIQETIRLFIREAYENWGVEYVLLGGDTDVLPARYTHSTYYPPDGTTDIPADLYFACLDGNWNDDGDYYFGEPYTHFLDPGDDADLAQEVSVGRAPVSSAAAAATFVDKIIAYETTPAGSGWPNRALFAAEVLFPQDYTPGEYIRTDGAEFAQNIIDDYLSPCTDMQSVRMFETHDLYGGAVPLSRTALIDSLNTGHYGVCNQIGHGFFFNMSVGDANFVNSDADALINGDHLFLLYALNCASAAFDNACLMERFVQNPNGGSVASIGASRAAFPYNSNEYQVLFFDALFCGEVNRLSELILLSRAPFLAETYFNSVDRWTQMNYTLLGDPSVAIWTDVPAAVQITAPAALSSGQQNVSITVRTGGSPVNGALVCLAKGEDDYAFATTNAAGVVVLPFTPTSDGNAVLTVTGRNLQRTQRIIPVSAGATYIALSDMIILDDGTAGSSGNGNAIIEAGETIAARPVVQDTGGAGASGCTATLTSSTSGVTILDGTATVGTVPPGGTLLSPQPFLVRFAANMADGKRADFNLVVTSGVNNYQDEWTATVAAPKLEAVALSWSDATYGNGNGIIGNGERVTVNVTLKNFGAGLGDLVTARLRTSDPEVTLYDSTTTYSDIALLSEAAAGAFSLADADVLTESWCWILFQDNFGRTFRHDFMLDPPPVPGGIWTDTSQGSTVIALHWDAVTGENVRGYNVYRSYAEGGPYVKANIDLIDNTSYFRDAGLELLTRYYYKVTSVDVSLVESPASPAVSQSTAPSELDLFPLPFVSESSSHCAVGDVDGDGTLEIVLAADEVNVWKANGGELFDGDGNAQTHGPITSTTTEVVFEPNGVTLADIDDYPGLEIIVTSRNKIGTYFENILHVYRADGTEVPGFPKQLRAAANGWNWATPAVGDVDGDGDPEIVVNTLDNRTWVWHRDGTELRDGDNNPATDGVFVYRPGGGEWGFSSPALCDLDGDGAKEIIFGTKWNDGQSNYLLAYRYDGTQAPGFPVPTNGIVICSPTIADLNNDGSVEIIFQRISEALMVIEADGSAYPGFPIPMDYNVWSNPGSSPAVGDIDQDGFLEIITVSVTSGGLAHLYVIDTTGATAGMPLSGWPRTLPGNSEASPVVGDIDGDHVLDILHGIGGGDEASPNNLYAFKANGEQVAGFPITLGGPLRPSPVICDLDQDGDVDIVHGGWDRLIHVWDMPFAYDPLLVPWPTFRGVMNRDGVYRARTLTDVPAAVLPRNLQVDSPYPNPFNPSTTIRLYLPGQAGSRQPLQVRVFDMQGRKVRTLHDGLIEAGWQTWIWDGQDDGGRAQASGLYFLRARSDEETVVRKMSLIK